MYEVTVAVALNGHKITKTRVVDAPDSETAKKIAEELTKMDILITSGTPRKKA